MPVKRIKQGEEPILHVHRYICTVGRTDNKGKRCTKFHYCINLKEVNALKGKLKKYHVLEVFKASHNYVAGYVNL